MRTTWINRLGTAILVPSIIALFAISIKLTPPISPSTDVKHLLGLVAIVGGMIIMGLHLCHYRGKPRDDATKSPSPSEEEEP